MILLILRKKNNDMKKFLKEALTFICILIYVLLFLFSLLLLYDAIEAEVKAVANSNTIFWICILSLIVIVFIALPIILYVKNKRFKNYIKKHKAKISSEITMFLGLFTSHIVIKLENRGIVNMKDPILWNWIIGISFAITLIVAIIYIIRYVKTKDDNLKLQIEPHTIRNIIEDMRLQIKSIYKEVNSRISDSQEDNAIKSKIKSLHYEMESTCDFLSEIAEDNSKGKNRNSINVELDNVNRYLKFRTNDNLWNVSFDVRLKDNKFEVPSRITTSMIENAFKHGEVAAPDFLKVSFVQDGDSYMIEVKNRVLKTGESLAKTGGLGINNLKQRVSLYNESQPLYKASMYNANKNDFYYFRIIFEKKK